MKRIYENFYAANQIQAKDIAQLKQEKFECVLCNRPDNEEQDQPSVEMIKSQCLANGIEFLHLPISPGDFNLEAIMETEKVLKTAKKTLAYCRTGTRSTMLWAFAKTKDLEVDEVLKITDHSGYNFQHLKELLETYKSTSS
ncbi:MAG: TIGR01244 family phosphatase [Thiotrichales bacterium TMED285]|jgi:sulfide:quinone oxidoreductase|nr:MAG: TIGR01244 family phosphatase [Thiotrichales bacterium TMED285]|tara:strand:+ start:28218 stop:28640 length:423 start_codon:yes stop_codon:yes gene_type:complete